MKVNKKSALLLPHTMSHVTSTVYHKQKSYFVFNPVLIPGFQKMFSLFYSGSELEIVKMCLLCLLLQKIPLRKV